MYRCDGGYKKYTLRGNWKLQIVFVYKVARLTDGVFSNVTILLPLNKYGVHIVRKRGQREEGKIDAENVAPSVNVARVYKTTVAK